MLRVLRRLRWNARYRDSIHVCLAHVHRQYFPALVRGSSLLDGMSGQAAVFLYANVESVEEDVLRVRVDYSVVCKGTVDAAGCYRMSCLLQTIIKQTHEPRELK